MNPLTIPGYGKLPHLRMDPSYFYRRSTTLYGVSGTGKSTILDGIMYSLKDLIPVIYVINPTGMISDSALPTRVPKGLIKLEPTVDALKALLDRQEQAMRTYNCVNNLDNLQRLFYMCNDYHNKQLIKNIIRKAFIQIRRIQQSSNNYLEKTKQQQNVKETRDKYLRISYKNAIRKYRDVLQKSNQLTNDDRFVLKFLDFCPDVMIVTDDAASLIKQWCKNPDMQRIFFTGRHRAITMVNCIQDDKGMIPGIRKNTFVSIFTEPSCAMTFFNTKANGFPKQIKKAAELIIEGLFKGSNKPDNRNFKKFVYNRLDDHNKFQYYVADPNLNYKFGCAALWRLWDSAPKKENVSVLKKDNPFYKSFSV